ncbi:MAG: DMT family transporter [Rhodobacteraceae bacterium]|nr:DMT family transporter [Paracoccaceae bacterium]
MTPYFKGFLITLAGVVLISPDTLLIRLIDAGTFTQLFWRGLLSGIVVLAGFAVLTGRDAPVRLLKIGWPGFWIALIFSTGTLCFIYSATHTLIANTLFIASTSPVFAALISVVFLRESVSLRIWATIVVTLGGIGVIASGSIDATGGASGGNLDGDLAALGAALSLAATFAIARANRTASMVPATGLAGLLSAAIAASLAPTLAVPADDWLWLALLGLIVAPGGFALLATGPRYLPAPDVSLLLLLEALLGPLLVWLVLAEFPGHRTLIGGGIVLAAMVVSNLAGWRQARAQARKAV